jgi:heat shock protein HslJ
MPRRAASTTTVKRRALASCVTLLAALVLASCGDDDTPQTIPASGERETTTAPLVSTTTVPPPRSLSGEWTIVSLATGGTITEAPPRASLAFAGGSVNVATGCNTGTATADTAADQAVTIGPIALTRMVCEPEVMTWEGDLTAFLEGELFYELSNDALVLIRDDGRLTLSTPP